MEDKKKPIYKKWWFWLIIMFLYSSTISPLVSLEISEMIIFILFMVMMICIVSSVNTKRKELENNVAKPSIQSTQTPKHNCKYIEGISNLVGEYEGTLQVVNNQLVFTIKKTKQQIKLDCNKIIAVGSKRETDKTVVQKGKSPVARGLLGGALFGGAGLVLGGLSGTGTKTETYYNNTDYILIKYISNNEDKTLVFQIYYTAKQLEKQLNAIIGNTANTIEL